MRFATNRITEPPPENTMVRFWRSVDTSQGCFIWLGQKNNYGYGRIQYNKKVFQAHRFIYEVVYGPAPHDRVVDHVCNNRACVNPFHLRLLTSRENVLRGNGYAGIKSRQTHCKHGHEFTLENTAWYKTSRACRVCHNEGTKRRYKLKRAMAGRL